MQGFVHACTGLDHLAAMLAIGAWSAVAVRPVWVAPAAFVAVLGLGALAGSAAGAVPGVEPMIAASLLVLGLLVCTRRGLPLAIAALLAGLFAFFHGAAHGAELSAGGAALAGLVAASALLHATGIALARGLAARRPWLTAVAGTSVAVFGAALLLQLA
jgi:urease accessory protein